MHDHNETGGTGMMLMVVTCCLVPLIIVITLGFQGTGMGISWWFVLGGIALMVGSHVLMMKSHKNHNKKPGGEETKTKDIRANDSNHHGCH